MRTLNSLRRVAIVLALALAMVGAAAFVAAPMARADHNTIPWGTPLTVASSLNFNYPYNAIVADSHGYVYVFYIAYNTVSSSANLNVSKYSSVGLFGSPVRLFDKQVNDVVNVVNPFYPIAAAVAPNGNLYVAWTRNTSPYTVYVSESSNGGATWQTARLASSPASQGNNYWPTIAVGPDGTVWVSWIQGWVTTSVTVSKSTDQGATFTAWTNVTSGNGIGTQSIAVDSGGRVYVAYSNFNGGYYINNTWSDNGVTWSSPTTLGGSHVYSIFPWVFADTSGYVHEAWFQSDGASWTINYARSADRGATWTGAIAITGQMGGGYIGSLTGEGDTVMYVWGSDSANGLGFVISADHGSSWYPDEAQSTGNVALSSVAADQNGTFWATALDASGHLNVRPWYGPPSRPMLDSVVASGSNGLKVTWTDAPEQNVAEYQVWRSGDGTTYQVVATLSASSTSYTDSGLTNGTYWYKVVAVNNHGTPSHDSNAASGVVGVTVQQLESEIAALQTALNTANANVAALQTQLTSVQAQLTALQNSQSASNSATAAELARLQSNLTSLQNQLNTIQSQQATQTISYANLAFEIIVVVLLVVLLLNQMRKPKNPKLMMAQPGQATSKGPDDDL